MCVARYIPIVIAVGDRVFSRWLYAPRCLRGVGTVRYVRVYHARNMVHKSTCYFIRIEGGADQRVSDAVRTKKEQQVVSTASLITKETQK